VRRSGSAPVALGPNPSISEIRYVDVPGASLGYQVIGEGSEKPAALMIHGYSTRSTGSRYAKFYEYLSQSFTIYALDTRGHGASAEYIENWSLNLIADDIAAVVSGLGLSRPFHIGHSYGGYMGLVTELRHPGTFTALSMLAPGAATGGAATPDEVKKTMISKGRDRDIMSEMFSAMYVNPPAPADLEQVIDAVVLVDPKVHEAYFLREYANFNIVEDLPKIGLPVLSVTGSRDVVVKPSEQHATTAGLPNAKEVTFSDEGHLLPVEDPERTAREVARFAEDVGYRGK
jgi:pimeloyl-ACP methyl ester carboxylesterase